MRILLVIAALTVPQTSCYPDEDEFTAEDFFEITVDDAEFFADGVSECVISASYPMGASTGQQLKVTTTLPGGAPETRMVATEARADAAPQELVRLRSSLQSGDAIVLVTADKWSQQVVCEAQRAWPSMLTLQANANTLLAGGATSSDLTVTVRRAQDNGTPSADTRVFLKACCADDDTSTCAGWFSVPAILSTTAMAPERIAQPLALSALGQALLNETADDQISAYEEARIFAVAVTEAGQLEPTCVDLNSTVDEDGDSTDPTTALTTLRLVRKSM